MLNVKQIASSLLSQFSRAETAMLDRKGFDFALEFVEWAHRKRYRHLAGFTPGQLHNVAHELWLAAGSPNPN